MSPLATIEASVSRETLADLREYLAAICKWNPAINLIAKSTLESAWERHILDGLQLWPLLKPFERLADLGTGGGIPGIPLAIAAKHAGAPFEFILVESDRRKAAFLSTMIHQFSLRARVLSDRIEEAPPQSADICTARALASTNDLFRYAERHLKPGGTCFFLKGQNVRAELLKAKEQWRFSLIEHESKTNPNAKILEVGELRRA